MTDEVGPVPAGLTAGTPNGELGATIEWLNRLLAIVQRSNSTGKEGWSFQMANVAKITQTVSNPPTNVEVAVIQIKVNELIDALVTAEKMEAP